MSSPKHQTVCRERVAFFVLQASRSSRKRRARGRRHSTPSHKDARLSRNSRVRSCTCFRSSLRRLRFAARRLWLLPSILATTGPIGGPAAARESGSGAGSQKNQWLGEEPAAARGCRWPCARVACLRSAWLRKRARERNTKPQWQAKALPFELPLMQDVISDNQTNKHNQKDRILRVVTDPTSLRDESSKERPLPPPPTVPCPWRLDPRHEGLASPLLLSHSLPGQPRARRERPTTRSG